MGRRTTLVAAAAAAALAVAAWWGGKALWTEDPPSEARLGQLCDEAYRAAHDQVATAGETASAEGEYFYTEGETSVVCEGGAWTVELAGSRTVGVELDLVFYTDEDSAARGEDYCDITGVGFPVDGSEERQFDGHPYCFWWSQGDAHHTGTATYFDRGIKVVLQWHIDSREDPFDAGTDVGALFFATNDTVLASIYEGFSQQ